MGSVVAARQRSIWQLTRPLLDLMQTMPVFVYLIPAVMLFSTGAVPSVIATLIFAMPPVVRLTVPGIRQVPADLIEAGRSFGCSEWQLLTKVQLPNALPTLMTGVNHSSGPHAEQHRQTQTANSREIDHQIDPKGSCEPHLGKNTKGRMIRAVLLS